MEAVPTHLLLTVAAAATLLWIYALVDVARRPSSQIQSGSKALWVLLIVLGHAAGAAVYLAVGRTPSTTRRA